MKRRNFISKIMASFGIAVSIPVILNSCDDEDSSVPEEGLVIDLSDPKYDSLENEGGFIYEENIIVTYLGGNEYVALARYCTYDGIEIEYITSIENFRCKGCQSVYDKNGNVVNGPAVDGVKAYTVTKDGNTLTIKE